LSDNYKAIVGKVRLVPIEGAKTLQMAYYNGLSFAVSKDFVEGALYLIFPPDGQLSKEYAEHNDLVRRRDLETGEQKGGFFEENRKVRSIKLMKGKVISVGFIATLETLPKYNGDLEEGDEVSEYRGVPICNKYVNEATKRASRGPNQPKKKKDYANIIGFAEHQDTSQFYKAAYSNIDSGDIITITLKLDGTSVRVGNPYLIKHNTWWNRLIAKVFNVNMHFNRVTAGTRRVVLDPSKIETAPDWIVYSMAKKKVLVKEFKTDIESTELYRQIFPTDETDAGKYTLQFLETFLPGFTQWYTNKNMSGGYYGDGHAMYREPEIRIGKSLLPGETVYGEIVGWANESKPLFVRGGIAFKYGCGPGKRDFYVYNIKITSPSGYTFSLPWNIIKQRCFELGVKYVPEMIIEEGCSQLVAPKFIDENHKKAWFEFFNKAVEELIHGADPIDPSHIREGVVIRVDKANTGQTIFMKAKSAEYYALEDASKSDESFVDIEEVESMQESAVV
jgi:truncated hemoglobin YjbI/co-chaperonin GroES (HSP10)